MKADICGVITLGVGEDPIHRGNPWVFSDIGLLLVETGGSVFVLECELEGVSTGCRRKVEEVWVSLRPVGGLFGDAATGDLEVQVGEGRGVRCLIPGEGQERFFGLVIGGHLGHHLIEPCSFSFGLDRGCDQFSGRAGFGSFG